MEATSMVYVTLILAGISLQAPEPVTLEQCTALKAQQPQTLCVDVEPACGKGEDVKCLGRADLDPPKAGATRKRRTVSRRRHFPLQREADGRAARAGDVLT